MSTTRPSIFLLGAGYVGQNLLETLLARNYPVTALVRRIEHASELEKAGAKTVIGTLGDLELITTQTAQHDITINTASCDDLPSVQAILSGIRKRVEADQPITFIHTSGTGELEDGALGMFKNPKIYRDDAPEDIDALPPTSMHRHVTIPLVQAAREFGNKARIAIILPPIIYGYNPSQNRHTFLARACVKFSLKHGFAGYVGEGLNVWNSVHVKDLCSAYLTLLAYIESSPEKVLENPYFFAENGEEVSLRECAENIGQVLYDIGKIPSIQLRPYTESDYDDIAGPFTPVGIGCNSRSRAIRLRELGWEPKEKGIFETWKEEIPVIVAELESS